MILKEQEEAPTAFKQTVHGVERVTELIQGLKGSGQGLAISYTIIHDRHGGEMSFHSKTDVGTTFNTKLPNNYVAPFYLSC